MNNTPNIIPPCTCTAPASLVVLLDIFPCFEPVKDKFINEHIYFEVDDKESIAVGFGHE
jgi:hypothetical protein